MPGARWKLFAVTLVIALGCAVFFLGERVTPGIVYTNHHGRSLKLDLHQPFTPGIHPLVIAVHGGFWKMGDRSQLAPYCIWLVRRGYTVACIDYSLFPEEPFPTALDDVAESIRFLKKSAPHYAIDPNRIALLGTSCGAHLAALVALNQDPSTRVQAVVDMYGPTDLTTQHMAEDTTVQEVFGRDLRAASPLAHVQGPCPPFLIIQGESDPVVPMQQSQDFYQRLLDTGNQASLLIVHHAGHDLMPVGGQPEPSLFQVAGHISDFLDQTLDPKGAN